MGIDNDAILVFGWVFSHEDFSNKAKKILHSVGIDPNYDFSSYDLLELFEEWLGDNYPDFSIGRASPYYDCYWTECEYYLTFTNVNTHDKLYNILKSIHEGIDKYELVGLMGLTDKPKLYALPNIW